LRSSHAGAMIVEPMTDEDQARRRVIEQHCAALSERGICPSCQQWSTGDVFPGQTAQTYYEDDRVGLHLETYPRGLGHTIIVSKAHYADIAAMPIELGCHIMWVTHAAVNALKDVVGADKVYMVTMCSGTMSHLHFQLIPRRLGEMIGGRVFASERGVLTNAHTMRVALAAEMARRLDGLSPS
jgi:histidine triad (HIT) family protein